MGLIKLAFLQQSKPTQPSIILINQKSDPNSGSSKTFSNRNVAATTASALGGFAGQEAIEHLPSFNKLNMSHRLGRRLGTAAGAFIGAATTYKLLKPKKKENSNQVMFL